MSGDEAFYYLHEEGEFQGAVFIHVEELILAGSMDFIEKIKILIAYKLTVSKVERDRFRYTGLDIEKFEDQVRVSMKDYAKIM